ncbi:cytochrome P450 [Neolentinus lepideus HHB14362 ss-1]|uniref:Cytochrome P450 n=1 Tax=Neolentinus lepideus HHB14362 ss-1 TaxID=1314782 RepID=A0A165NZ02_9AGAM|nr:cytochrome P450 [Neolentinus lepideus HHB14362 ss-1]
MVVVTYLLSTIHSHSKTMWPSLAAFALLLLIFAASRISKFVTGLKKVRYLPGFRCALGSMSFPGSMLPTNYFNPGFDWCWKWRNKSYFSYRSQTISVVPFLSGVPVVYTCSIDVAKQILTQRGFWKDPEATTPLTLWGNNLLAANHGVHRKHRKIVGPAFNGSAYAFVAQETSRLYAYMVESEGWDKQQVVNLEPINGYVSKFALGLIARCAFGLPFPWNTDNSNGMSFDRALMAVSSGTILRLATPCWAYKLPIKRLHEVDEAFKNLAKFMRTFVTDKKAELASKGRGVNNSKDDLFTRLVAANEAEGKNGLEDQELIGNVFTFMFAGHETTAHVLQACLALLSIHPGEQETCYQNILQVLGDSRDPNVGDFDALDKVLACFEEAARMFPGVSMLVRDTEDMVSLILPPEDGGRTIVLEPGVRVVVDLVGIHYNPRIFPDPERFYPARWQGVRESDLPFFGWGPRACVGRKFALVEAVSFLALFLRDWQVEPILRDDETNLQWRERTLQGTLVGLAFGVRDVPLRLRRRGKGQRSI